MPKRETKPVKVNIIAGSLGVGKTTAINELLATRPEGEQWAVLVNEYGLVGLDAALMEDQERPSVEIKEVAGGCICCTAGFLFDMYLVLLLARRPDRLLIEPTGLAELTGILQTLARPGITESVDLCTSFCLLDPQRYLEDFKRKELRDQVESADVLLCSRADLATPEQLSAFKTWGESLFPPKLHVGSVSHGKIPLELLDKVSSRSRTSPLPEPVLSSAEPRHLAKQVEHDHSHGHEHDHDHNHGTLAPGAEVTCDEEHPIVALSHSSSAAQSLGWVCWEGLCFHEERLTAWLQTVAMTEHTLRVKASMRTNRGWTLYNLCGEYSEVRQTGPKRDSRLEFLFDPQNGPCPEEFEATLRGMLLES